MKKLPPVITIDGLSGSGKGTIAILLAQELGWTVLDSGLLYRLLALEIRTQDLSLDRENAISVLAKNMKVSFSSKSTITNTTQVYLEGKDVTKEIRSEDIASKASIIAKCPSVRTTLLERQRELRIHPGLVADGRDMGSTVFPDAVLKIFMKADIEVRAYRRYLQLKENNDNVNLSKVIESMYKRDKFDLSRQASPLTIPKDAMQINSTKLSTKQILEKIKSKICLLGIVK